MALPLNDGFQVAALDPIDTRIVLTKEQMLNANVDDYPDVYFALCVDDGQWYRFDYEVADPDPETGHFKKLELGGGTPSAEAGPVSERPEAGESNVGDKWYDPETGKTYIVVKDSEGNLQWVESTPAAGEMLYDSTNGTILYFDGTEWKPVGGGIEKETSVDTSKPGTPGDIVYDETTKQYMIYEPAASGESSGIWVNMAKVLEVTEAQYTTLGGDTWSTNHPDVLIFVK